VLPRAFVKVRHYGLLANRRRAQRLALSRRLLLVAGVAARLTAAAPATLLEPAPPPCCPNCGGTRLLYRALPADRAAAAPEPSDSS